MSLAIAAASTTGVVAFLQVVVPLEGWTGWGAWSTVDYLASNAAGVDGASATRLVVTVWEVSARRDAVPTSPLTIVVLHPLDLGFLMDIRLSLAVTRSGSADAPLRYVVPLERSRAGSSIDKLAGDAAGVEGATVARLVITVLQTLTAANARLSCCLAVV